MILLGYGPISDLVAVQKARQQEVRPRRKGENVDVAQYMAYSRRLGMEFRYYPVDRQDVEQEALVGAWEALKDNPDVSLGVVQRMMRERVTGFVRRSGNDRLNAGTYRLPEER